MSDRDDLPRKPYAGGPRPDLRSTIYVGNLSEGTEPRDVEDLFIDGGFRVQECSIPFDRAMQRYKPFGFVMLEHEDDVDDAVKKMSGTQLRGRTIRCEKREPNPDPDRSWRPGDKGRGKGGRGNGGNGGRSRSRGRGGGGRRDDSRRGGGRRDDSRRGRGGGRRDSRRR